VQPHIFPLYYIPKRKAPEHIEDGYTGPVPSFSPGEFPPEWHFGDLYHSSELWNTDKQAGKAAKPYAKHFFFLVFFSSLRPIRLKKHRRSSRHYIDPLNLWGNSNLVVLLRLSVTVAWEKTLMESEVLVDGHEMITATRDWLNVYHHVLQFTVPTGAS